ncbi:hypothetical protein ACQEVF_34190 [Nonomuraea polychroma]|uniref:hypothetical protein n=1 Tax=Nonomuraea polychroma TaxID=46176 RepID=UPI003D8F42BC
MTPTVIRAHFYIVHPRAESLLLGEVSPGGTLGLHFDPDGRAYIMLGGPGADREADAKAMDRLAELATKAAAKLRAPLPERDGA